MELILALTSFANDPYKHEKRPSYPSLLPFTFFSHPSPPHHCCAAHLCPDPKSLPHITTVTQPSSSMTTFVPRYPLTTHTQPQPNLNPATLTPHSTPPRCHNNFHIWVLIFGPTEICFY